MPKVFKCSACKGQHQRPTGAKCKFMNFNQEADELNDSFTNSESSSVRADAQSTNTDILNALQAVSSRLSAIEQRIERTEEKLEAAPAQTGSQDLHGKPQAPASSDTWHKEQHQDTVVPSIQALKGSQLIQKQVDERLQQLSQLNEKGTCKSQRGGTDTVWVKNQTPWPQNFILGGPNKNRVLYDNLTVFQWMSGFAQIIKEETDISTKNAMLEYMSDLMDDAQDFGWHPAKASHAVLLCRMEEGKISWQETQKIDRIRRTHAQRASTSQTNYSQPQKKQNDNTNPCKFYQNLTCPQKGDHTTGGQNYKHVCAICNAYGRKLAHPAKDCRLVRPAKNE